MPNQSELKINRQIVVFLRPSGERDGLKRREEWNFLLGTVLTTKTINP
jgi:hypothetical protein